MPFEIVFAASLAVLTYVYFGFFVLVLLLAKFFYRPVEKKRYPAVSVAYCLRLQ